MAEAEGLERQDGARRGVVLARVMVAAFSIAVTVGVSAQVPPPPPPLGGAETVAMAGASAPAGPLRFEAASIKRNRASSMLVSIGGGRGRFQAMNVTVATLLNQALRVPAPQIIGAPDWAQNERYDVVAKMPDGVQLAPGVQQDMLRALLEERFSLSTHKETREMPIFALVVARPDGRLGSDIAVSKNDCSPGARRGGGPDGQIPGPTQFGRGARPVCGTMAGPGLISSGGMTMLRLADMLSGLVGRTVVDRTGLGGFYDLDIVYLPDQVPTGPLPPGMQMPFTPESPGLQTAIQEQLGLKLEATRAPIEVTVIDRLERPMED